MKILQIFFATLIIQKCYTEFVPIFQPFNPILAPTLPICPSTNHQFSPVPFKSILDNTTAVVENPKDDFKFILPFVKMQIRTDRTLFVIQDQQKQQIYVLQGNELFQLIVNRQEIRLVFLGILEGSAHYIEPWGAKIISTAGGNLLLVIALEEHLEIYQLAEDVLLQRIKNSGKNHEEPPVFLPIQQLTLRGRFQKLFLFSPSEERIMIVAVTNFATLYGKLRIFEWFNTYFDPIKDMTFPAIHVVNIIGSETKYLILGKIIKHKPSTILTVYEISRTLPEITVKQTLTVKSRVVHIFSYQHRNMIVACSSKQKKCNSFRQATDGHFVVYRQRTPKEFAFDHILGTSLFIAASRQNQIMVFTNHRLDCYRSFVSDQQDITDLMSIQNANKEAYLLLVYNRPFKTLVHIVELEIIVNDLPTVRQSEPEELLASNHHHHLFEQTIGKLRSMLLQRKSDMDIFRKLIQFIKMKQNYIEVNEGVNLHAGKVGLIKIVNESLNSPSQIMQKIESLQRNYRPQRLKRAKNYLLNETNNLKVKRLKVQNLIYQGDVLEGFSLNSKNLSNQVLNVKPKVRTRALNTFQLILPKYISQAFLDLIPAVHVHHLKVDFINGIPWNDFYDSLFLKNRDSFIESNLLLHSPVKVEHLTTTFLNDLEISNLINLKHPQIIQTDLILSAISLNDLQSRRINGLNFGDDVVFSGSNNTFVKTPVSINHLKISGDLFMADNKKVKHLVSNSDEVELHQVYKNEVILNGKLIVNNLKRSKRNSSIILEGEEFKEDEIKKLYLFKEEAQHFSFPVTFEDATVTAISLETTSLNDYPIEQYMLVNTLNYEKPLRLVFMNAQIKGDVILRDYKSKIAEMKENIVYPGDKVHITGRKIFEAPLEIKNAEVVSLNELAVNDFVFKSLLKEKVFLQFKDTKVFTKIKVKKPAIVDKGLKASHLNNLPLRNFLNNDYFMDRLSIDHLLHTTNLVFQKINGIPFKEFFAKLDVQNEQLVLHKDILVEGNVQFVQPLNVEYINDIYWIEYEKNLVRVNENAVIEGEVCFNEDLTITKSFETSDINAYDLEHIMKNVLLKHQPQWITGHYHFDHMQATNVDVLFVNNINVADFMDLSKNYTEIEGDIVVENLYVEGNMQGSLKQLEFLYRLEEKIQQMILKPWKSLYVLNDASWPLNVADNSQQELLKYFYRYAVLKNRHQIISGNVKMTNPIIENMQTRLQFPTNVDLEFLQKDAVLKNSTVKQIIKGEKVFLKTLRMETLKAHKNVKTNYVNEVDVFKFNQSLYRLTDEQLLEEPLKFLKPLTINYLEINGFVNGLDPNRIYQLGAFLALPSIQLHELYVENDLVIEYINDMNMEYFLKNRLTLQGKALEHFGHLTFENLVIEKEALIQSINGIAIDNLVFKHSPYLQTITGRKTIKTNLELAGPAHVLQLNDNDLMELYRNSLHKHHNYEFNHLILEEAKFDKGLQAVNKLNNNNLLYRSFGENDEMWSMNYLQFLKFLKEFKANLNNSYKDVIYLDYDFDIQVNWLDSKDHITANQTIYHELSRISSCEKRYIQISLLQPNTIYLKNVTSQVLTKISNKIAIKAENFCLNQKRKVKSKITLTGPKMLKVFALKRFIETVYICDNVVNPVEKFVIIHALDLPNLKKNEIRIFKISLKNNTIHEWQGLTKNIGLQLKYFKLSQLQILLTNGKVDHHPALTIYHFHNYTQLFKVQQIIDGDYDIIEMLEVPNNQATKQLILSCSKCQRIFVYEFSATEKSQNYKIQQIISLKSPINKLIIFNLNNSFYMLVTSQPNYGFYCIYKYSYIQGWLPFTFGYFSNLQMSLPLTELWTKDNGLILSLSSDGIPLMLLCKPNNCYVVKAII